MEDYLKVGVVTTTHGIKGELKVFPTTDSPERFLELSEVLADAGKELLPLTLEKVRFFKNLVIVKFKEYNTCDDVMFLKGKDLLIPRSEGAELGEDEYYIADLLGMKVVLEDGSDYGTLKDVMETGANDVYIVTRTDGSEILLPAIHDCILDVDPEEGRMTVRIMKGLE